MLLALLPALLLLGLVAASSMKIAGQHERVVIFHLGRLDPEIRGPGLFVVVPLVDRVLRIDLRRQTVAEAVGAHHWLLGKEGVVDDTGLAVIAGQRFHARSESGEPLPPGERVRAVALADDLQLVVGSITAPTQEEEP